MVLMAPGAPRESIETFRDVSSSILNRLTRLKMTLSYSYSIYLYLQISIPFQGKKTDHRPKSVSETIWVDSSKNPDSSVAQAAKCRSLLVVVHVIKML